MKGMRLFLLGFTLALGASLMAFWSPNSPQGGYKPGDKARDFSLKGIDGKATSLASHAGKNGAIVIFTCNHCPFSVKYEDRIIALHKKMAPQGYPVIAINPNSPEDYPEDSFDNMIIRAKEKGFGFPYCVDETQEIARTYGAQKTPHIFLLQRKGSDFEVAYIGSIDNNANEAAKADKKYVEQAIAELQAGKPVSTPEAKAIGCSIKWKGEK